ncbi:MAG: deoxyribonuclease HsdR [Bacteroidota bacterium]|jgi:hypothetical protein|nr:deoxyribonuclease HsdR [Bacteroidota bacterium]
MAFGILMLASVLRFIAKGWVYDMYIKPKLFFPYYGFEWIKPLDSIGMYLVFIILAIASLFIALGFFYRASAVLFFVLFTYVELIDKTNYLNHYYFISIASFILIFLPAHRYFSMDVWRNKKLKASHVPNYFILAIKLQVFVVYFFAGLAKINNDWLLEAQPLKIWLPAHSEMPLIGSFLTKEWVAYFFSWFGCIYDLTIPFLLFIPRFVKPAYFFVIVFHLATSLLFNIGMFPYIMIALTTIFFTENFHLKIIGWLRLRTGKKELSEIKVLYVPEKLRLAPLTCLFVIHFTIQVLMPFRYLLYGGNLYWTEQGYRFSWRVMLMEKAGTAVFYVRDKSTGRETEIINCDYLTPMQEKMMATQPDMLINYAHFLKNEFKSQGMNDPEILVESYVTLNGKASRLMVNKSTDLSLAEDDFAEKKWILPNSN